MAAIYEPKKSISPVSLIIIASEYAKIFLSLHFAHAKSMLTALNIRFFGTVIDKTHSWMTTYTAASPRFKNKFFEDLGKLGFNFQEMVDLSSPHTYTKLKSSTINCQCEFSKKVIPTFVFDFVAKMKTEVCRRPKQVLSYVRQRIAPSNQWLRALEKDKSRNVVSQHVSKFRLSKYMKGHFEKITKTRNPVKRQWTKPLPVKFQFKKAKRHVDSSSSPSSSSDESSDRMTSSSDEFNSSDDDQGFGEAVVKWERNSSLSDIASTSVAIGGNSVMATSLAEEEAIILADDNEEKVSIAVEKPVDTSSTVVEPSQGNDTFQAQDASQIIETSQLQNTQTSQFQNQQLFQFQNLQPFQFQNLQPFQVENLQPFQFFQIAESPINDIINYGPLTLFNYPYLILESSQQQQSTIVQPIPIHRFTSFLLEWTLVNSYSLNTSTRRTTDSFSTINQSELNSIDSSLSTNSIIEGPHEIR